MHNPNPSLTQPQPASHASHQPQSQSQSQSQSQPQMQMQLQMQVQMPRNQPSQDILPPPHYDSHQFPPTPPALTSAHGGHGSGYFDQPHGVHSERAGGSEHAWSVSESPQAGLASRFPRWGGWVEKRALERHYARLEAQQQCALGEVHGRKKSWGAWVNDADAINDVQQTDSNSEPIGSNDECKSLPPLHVHHFGSRFIPHLPAQPLCSILVQLPPNAYHHTVPHRSSRQVLLIGTHQGLFAVQLRHSHRAFGDVPMRSSASLRAHGWRKQWNDDIRCIQIWKGLAVYQMCVLASNDRPTHSNTTTTTTATSSTTATAGTSNSGVFLALTSPTSVRDAGLSSSLMQLSAHAGSVLENVAASTGFASSSSSLAHGGYGATDLNEAVAAANFGSNAGGGPGRAVPKGGTGVVRMWHLQSIRELVVYALDRYDAQLPIDLEQTSAVGGGGGKRGGISTMLRNTFSKSRLKVDARGGLHRRSGSSASLSATITALTRPMEDAVSQSAVQAQMNTMPRRSGVSQASFRGSKRPPDASHAAAVVLASSSVPIQPPAHTTAASHASNPSLVSFFADDLMQSFSGGRQTGTKGKEREASVQAASKGVLFFSVHEAGVDTKGSGTWYLAITYARSVMVYEASLPKRGESRAWSFVKEVYAPFPIKAVAFSPAAVSDEAAPFVAGAGPTKLRVATAEGPLSTLKKGTYRDASGLGGGQRGGAAPAAWKKADLCLFLSFGRRAVLVRLRDSQVRELELRPLAQLVAAAGEGGEGGFGVQLSLQPHPLLGQVDQSARFDRSRPASVTGEGGSWTESQIPSTSGHSRAGSMEQKVRDMLLDKRSNKHNWIGFCSLEARIFVRQRTHATSDARDERTGCADGFAGCQEAMGLSPMGVSMAKTLDARMGVSQAAVDKDLPSVPAHQNASFDRRLSRLHLSPQTWQYHDELQAESSSDSDEADGRETAAKYQLTDPGPLLQVRGCNDGTTAHGKVPNRCSSGARTELVSARLAFASRGGVTHVLQLPLAADLAQTPPLAVMQWSDTPNAVSGWARVLGVERASSNGTTSLNHLRQTHASPMSPDAAGSVADARCAASNARRRGGRLVLHVGVTGVAFLASRIESRKVSFKVGVDVDFDVSPDSELELLPVVASGEYNRVDGATEDMGWSAPDPARGWGDVDDDDSTSVGDGWQGAARRGGFAYPSIASRLDRVGEASVVSRELEYLCGPLLTLHPIDLDVRSCGSQSVVLRCAAGERGSGSAVHKLFPVLAGDAGIVAFDWRGADDFRIFIVGIAG